MGRKRKKDKWSNEEIFWLVLIFPIALVCAYPILLVPIIIGVVLWLAHNIIKLVEKIKSNKIVKKLQKEYSLKAVVERANKESSASKKDISKKVTSDKTNDNTNANTNSFNEILSICNDIEDKLLELDVIYFDVAEENIELNSMFSELEEYNKIIRDFRNKKLVELNDELLKEARECHKRFLELYNEFNLLVEEESLSNDVDGSEEEVIEEDDVSDSLVAGAVGYSLYKKRQEEKEEKEREEYREELRNVWGLTEYQIGLVESGEYEPGQFSEEELEEDDYYSEDK